MSDPSRHFRLRALLAAGAVAVTALGAGQAIGTSAASTDAVAATSGSLTAAANVLPASDTAWCDNYKNGTYLAVANWDSQVSIRQVNKAFDYKMFVMQDNGTVALQDMKDASTFNLGDRLYFTPVSGNNLGRHTGWNFTIRIYSVNRVTKEFSGNWIGWRINQPTVYQTNCSGGQLIGTDTPPNTTTNNATSGNVQAMSVKVSGPAEQARSLSAPATTGADKSTTAQSDQAVAQSVSPAAPAGTTENDSTPVTTTTAPTSPAATTTATPKPATSETATTAPTTTGPTSTATEPVNTSVTLGKGLSAELTSDGGKSQVVISNGSGEVCRADVSPAERILTPEGDGTLSVAGNGGVRNIDTATCAIA